MTESEWLADPDPDAMLCFLQGKVSQRKWQLFACAIARHLWDLLEPRSKSAVETVERFADGDATEEDLAGAQRLALAATEALHGTVPRHADCALQAVCGDARRAAFLAAGLRYRPAGNADFNNLEDPAWAGLDGAIRADQVWQRALTREVFGNPFRPPVLDPAWRSPPVLAIARTAYEGRRWEELGFLADALDEAGCDDEELLGHCRGPGPHVLGCWAVDRILDKA